jgi:hypothetical protein
MAIQHDSLPEINGTSKAVVAPVISLRSGYAA